MAFLICDIATALIVSVAFKVKMVLEVHAFLLLLIYIFYIYYILLDKLMSLFLPEMIIFQIIVGFFR